MQEGTYSEQQGSLPLVGGQQQQPAAVTVIIEQRDVRLEESAGCAGVGGGWEVCCHLICVTLIASSFITLHINLHPCSKIKKRHINGRKIFIIILLLSSVVVVVLGHRR